MRELSRLHDIFTRTREAAGSFMDMLQPLIDNAPDDHSRLYYHHIYEEEEQRLERLDELLPHLEQLMADGKAQELGNRELSRLLSDINLERFGLHNFREHLELALYEFQDEERRGQLAQMREMTHNDYLAVAEVMNALSESFTEGKPVNLTNHDEGYDVHAIDHVEASRKAVAAADERPPVPAATTSGSTGSRNRLTVGSLRNIPL